MTTFSTNSARFSKLLSCLGFACVLSLLSACGSDYVPRIPAFEKNEKTTNDVVETTSHMAKEASLKLRPNNTTNKAAKTLTRTSLNPKNLFGKDLRTTEERLDRLERAVQDMRHEFDNVAPSIKRLMAIEGDIQELIVELRRLSEDPSMATPMTIRKRPSVTPQVVKAPKTVRPAPISKKALPSPSAKAIPPVQKGYANIYNIRVGEHPGKTRIVLDVNTKTRFSTDIDNNEKIMIVELPKAKWSARSHGTFEKSSFLSSYKVESSGEGQLLIFQLKRDAKISYKSDIASLQGTGRRIVIDLSAN